MKEDQGMMLCPRYRQLQSKKVTIITQYHYGHTITSQVQSRLRVWILTHSATMLVPFTVIYSDVAELWELVR